MTVSDGRLPSSWQAPAQAFARWTALLMGWVWLGQQGQRLSWSIASGLTAVALWWAVRMILAPKPLGRAANARHISLALGLSAAAGATWLGRAESGPLAQTVLLGLAVVWAAWTSSLAPAAGTPTRCRRPWAGWPPLLAALATWACVIAPAPLAGALLLATTAMAWLAAPRITPIQPFTQIARRQPATASLHETIPATAMGWMMGSLWLSNAWCASAGWSSSAVVGTHLMLMAALPALIRMDWLPSRLPPLANRLLPLLLVAAGGGLLFAGQNLANGLVGMFLLALAWALPDRSPASGQPPKASAAARWAPLAGPLVLLSIGQGSPSFGPQVTAWAYGTLALVAGAGAVWSGWHREDAGQPPPLRQS
jgi:hypothetical protein